MRNAHFDANGCLVPPSLSFFFYCLRYTFELDEMDNERIPQDKLFLELGETIAKRGPDRDIWGHRAGPSSQYSFQIV